jgi:hypothetical protein
MKTFSVEGEHWFKDVDVDDSLYDKEGDMAHEAMTQAIESFFEGEYEEEFTGEPSLGLFTVAYPKGKGHIEQERSMALTEYLLVNAGYHDLAAQFKRYAIEQLEKDMKKKRKGE